LSVPTPRSGSFLCHEAFKLYSQIHSSIPLRLRLCTCYAPHPYLCETLIGSTLETCGPRLFFLQLQLPTNFERAQSWIRIGIMNAWTRLAARHITPHEHIPQFRSHNSKRNGHAEAVLLELCCVSYQLMDAVGASTMLQLELETPHENVEELVLELLRF
jgi:hypothetical protein